MTRPRWQWLERERRAFCEQLALTGDPVAAAAVIDRPLSEAYRQRECVPGFEAAWQKALSIAWDHVETRVLANLLAPPRAGAAGDDGAAGAGAGAGRARGGDGGVRLLDSRMALAVLQRRDTARTVRGPRADGGRVSALRDEIRALATR